MSKLYLFARDVEHSFDSVDPDTGKTNTKKFGVLSFLNEHGVLWKPMPDDYVLWKRRGKDGQVVKMRDLGVVVLCRVDASGQVTNVFNGRNDFQKPCSISFNTVGELKQIFGGAQIKGASR